jgi:GNAT superfamily N-acetyltransferase
MDEIRVVKVINRQEMDDFLNITDKIYAGCKQYVPDMRSDVRAMFASNNSSHQATTEIQPFVAYRGQEVVGRVVGVVNRKANEAWKARNVRFSMIEFIDDLAVSKALLDTVAAWGKSLGMDRLQGPMGVTDFDKEGMLIEDFDMRGSMTAYYNPEYYPRHMEQLGLVKEVDWLQVRIKIPKEVPARYARVAQYAREQFGLKVVKGNRHEVQKGAYGPKIFKLLNESYAPLFGFAALSDVQAQKFLDKYVPLFNMDFIPLVENEQGELVGIAVTMASLAEALQKSRGRLWPTGWYHLLKSLKVKPENNTEMLLIAVRPDYQGLGVNALFFDDLIPLYNKYGIEWAETGPQLEDNVRELSQWKPLHPEIVKRRRCWGKTIEN